jgi:hypothetical protein
VTPRGKGDRDTRGCSACVVGLTFAANSHLENGFAVLLSSSKTGLCGGLSFVKKPGGIHKRFDFIIL